jgi:hypothetical protein
MSGSHNASSLLNERRGKQEMRMHDRTQIEKSQQMLARARREIAGIPALDVAAFAERALAEAWRHMEAAAALDRSLPRQRGEEAERAEADHAEALSRALETHVRALAALETLPAVERAGIIQRAFRLHRP